MQLKRKLQLYLVKVVRGRAKTKRGGFEKEAKMAYEFNQQGSLFPTFQVR